MGMTPTARRILLGILVLRPLLRGRDLGVTVERYSHVATWSLAFVALSGLLNAAVRVGSWRGLASAYGLLIVLKVLLLVALALVGLRQRRAYVARLRENPALAAGFARFAAIELAVMGLAVGLGVALSRSAPPVPEVQPGITAAESLTGYPAPAVPQGWSWLSTWRVDWLWLSLSLIAVGLYLHGVRVLHRRGDRWRAVHLPQGAGGTASTCARPVHARPPHRGARPHGGLDP